MWPGHAPVGRSCSTPGWRLSKRLRVNACCGETFLAASVGGFTWINRRGSTVTWLSHTAAADEGPAPRNGSGTEPGSGHPTDLDGREGGRELIRAIRRRPSGKEEASGYSRTGWLSGPCQARSVPGRQVGRPAAACQQQECPGASSSREPVR